MGVRLTDASIFSLRVEAIVNPVNCVGVSGAGLAREFARRFPDNERKYRAACNSGTIRPGRGLITETGLDIPRFIVNFPTKRDWRDHSRLSDIERGLTNLHRELLHRNIRSIGMPALGAGLGGLEWNQVRQLIESEFSNEMEIAVMVCNPR